MLNRKLFSIIALGIILSLAGCMSTELKHQEQGPIITRHIPLPMVDHIQHTGSFDVVLRQASTPEVIVVGPAIYTQYVVASINGKELIVDDKWINKNARLKVIICLPNLHRLDLYGPGNISGMNINSDRLYVETHGTGNIFIQGLKTDTMRVVNTGSGDIQLSGDMNIDEIVQAGSGEININWVDSDALKVRDYGTGRLILSGIAKKLDAVVSQNAKLDAKYLRTRTAYVNALASSTAHVNASETLNALATSHAVIYYYKDPQLLADYELDQGHIVRMVGIEREVDDRV